MAKATGPERFVQTARARNMARTASQTDLDTDADQTNPLLNPRVTGTNADQTHARARGILN
eukprot:4850390-Lingulodinium_polyedra.AAC.1